MNPGGVVVGGGGGGGGGGGVVVIPSRWTENDLAERLMWEEFPMHRCCRDGDSSSLFGLVTRGAHGVFVEDSLYGWTPIHWASRFDRVSCLEVLVRQTSLVHSCDVQVSGTRQTPLHVAAEFGALDVSRWLVDRGADPNQKDYLGETSLHKAARFGSTDIIGLLGNAGAWSSVNLEGKSPLDLAVGASAKNLLYQLLLSSPYGETDERDAAMEDACDYHNSVNIPSGKFNSIISTKNLSSVQTSTNSNNSKRPRPTEGDKRAKRPRRSSDFFGGGGGGGGDIPDLGFPFERRASNNDDDDDDDDEDPEPHRGFSSSSSSFDLSVDGNGFHDDHERNNGMKTISSRIDGQHAAAAAAAAASSSRAEEEEEEEEEEAEEMEEADSAESTTTASTIVGPQLPPHLIPPLASDELLVDDGIGIPMLAGGRIDNGKSGRSKCVWFRSSCYI